MSKPNGKTTIALILMGMLLLAAPVKAEYGYPEIAPQASIDACLEGIAEAADYDGAHFVRHEVESEARRMHGHLLRISTQVYSDVDGALIRAYRTRCATTHDSRQVAFRISEKQ